MEVKNLCKTYKTEYEVVHALNNMDLKFPDHGLVFIVGVSGSGKSTLMNMLSGVDTPTLGEVVVEGKSLFKEAKHELFGYRNSYVGLIFQDYNLIEDMNVYDNIKLPLELLGYDDFSIIDEVIKKVDIEDIKYSAVTEISSGQMQRVAIARALVKDSAVILADEPTGNLDSKNTKIVMDLLKEISKTRLVVVITHDDDAAHEYGDEIIQIEDGNILENKVVNEEINTELEVKHNADFIDPKISFKKQVTFTRNFIRSGKLRSLSILLLMILIPFIGNILCSYVFFDIQKSYSEYQKEYGSEFVMLADTKSGYTVNYDDIGAMELMNDYDGSSLVLVYGTNYHTNLEKDDDGCYLDDSESFYKMEVKNIIIDDGSFVYEDGNSPLEEVKSSNKVAITDYFREAYREYRGREIGVGDSIEINGVYYSVCGIVDTTYENFIDYDESDLFTSMAFTENLEYYNAFYMSNEGKDNWWKNMTYFEEDVKYRLTSTIPAVDKYARVVVRKYSGHVIPEITYGKASFSGKSCVITYKMWTELLEKTQEQASRGLILSSSISFTCFTRTKYLLGLRTSGAYTNYQSTGFNNPYKYEVIVSDNTFKASLNKQIECKFLVRTTDINYKEILLNENVINQSFTFAKNTWEKCDKTKYVMIEFIITLILVTTVFAFIMDSMTMNSEKKKIGIKYSFGIKKKDIVKPYIFEIVLYIIVGLVVSLAFTKVLYPLFTKLFIYTSPQAIKENYFFYVGWESIVFWDIAIYLIMLVSLLVMVYKICKKSPIEIIKDL